MAEQMQQFLPSEENEWGDLNDASVTRWLKEACATGKPGSYAKLTSREIAKHLQSPSSEKDIEARLDRAVEQGIVEKILDGAIPRYSPKSR